MPATNDERPRSLAGALGRIGGQLLAPLTGGVSLLRHARMFHPSGHVFRAEVEAVDGPDERLRRAGARVSGPAIARLSSAWWKRRQWRDVLGIALRLTRESAPSVDPAPGDQDLLFATIRSPWTTPLAPLTTDVRDFLANDYYAVSPFEDPDLGRVRYRLVSPHVVLEGRREDRLAEAVRQGLAVFRLEASDGGEYRTFATVALRAPIDLDQAALRFSPFRDGRGMRPVGFVHNLRKGAYAASQRARPGTDGEA